MGKKSHINPNIEPDLSNRGDPFHYGRKKYSPKERDELAKARAKDYRKYGAGQVVGAGGSPATTDKNVTYRVVNKPVKPNETYAAMMKAREGGNPNKPKRKKFVRPSDYENALKKKRR